MRTKTYLFALLLLSLLGTSKAFAAITLSHVTITDVTHSNASIVWHADIASTPSVEIYSDADGINIITQQFEVEPFPLNNPNNDIRSQQQAAGIMRLQVLGLQPNSRYYIRVLSTSSNDSGVWPAEGLTPLDTQQENSFTSAAAQLVVQVNDSEDITGWPVIVRLNNTAYPVSALVADGSPTNDSAVLNLANLYNLSGTNYSLAALETVNIELLNNQGELITRSVDVNFSSEFSVASSSDFAFSTSTAIDSDGDGTPDHLDEFPNNPDLTEHPYVESEGITRRWWSDLSGISLDSLLNSSRFPDNPSGEETLSEFAGPSDWAENYGSKISGVFYAPESGNYTFWIAGDDSGELWLSHNNNAANKRRIAYLPSWVAPQQWDTFAQQRSESIFLEQGQAYYLEALHKESTWIDHLAIAWSTPSGDGIEIIPQEHFFKPNDIVDTDNDGVADNIDRFPNDPFETTDTDGDGLGDNSDAFLNDANETTDTDGDGVGDNQDIYPNDPSRTQGENTPTAGILWEWWDNISGAFIEIFTGDERFPDNPTGSQQLDEFAGPENWSDDFGSRISGVFYAPETGEYSFWVSGDDNVELWLSLNNNSANKRRIAHVPGWTDALDWDKYPEQQSPPILLEQGQAYYIETLHIDRGSSDHVAVGWLRPSGSDIEVLSAQYFRASKELDSDGDGVPDSVDRFPNDPTETTDTDGDGIGDNADRFPLNPNESQDSDGDGVGDNSDAYPNDSSRQRQPNVPDYGITRQWWVNIDGNSVDDLRADTNYPARPAGEESRPEFSGPSDWGNEYGSRISGVFYAPETGDYHFLIASDDNSELWLSSNNNPLKKRLIAHVPVWTGPLEWYKYPQQQSQAIHLRAGQAYYLEAIHKEGRAQDHVAVAWLIPSSAEPSLIGEQYFRPIALPSEDRDGDGVADTVDDFPDNVEETIDTDGDGVGDNADAFPLDASEAADTDGDGVGDNTDAFPEDPQRS